MLSYTVENSSRVSVSFIKQKCGCSNMDIMFSQPISITSKIVNPYISEYEYTIEDNLNFTTQPCNLGGFRLYFKCNGCQRRVLILYCPYGRSQYLCRHCHRLYYRSQLNRRGTLWEGYFKHIYKLNKIQKRLKNKWLRTPTKIRLIRQYEKVEKQLNKGLKDTLNKAI